MPVTFPYMGFLDGVAYPAIPLGTSVVNVSTAAALTAALTNATPGQRIVLASGTYSGTFTLASKAGTGSAGISIEAGIVGGAVFAAGSNITIRDSSYVTLSGLALPYEIPAGAANWNNVQFRGASHHCRATRCLLGPTVLGTAGTENTPYIYVGDACEHIRIDHNELRFKTNPGNGILVDGNTTTNVVAKHVRIDHNYIHDFGPEQSGAEKVPIRIGTAAMSKTFSYSVVERNVFVGLKAGPEVVSARASGIRVSGNTFSRCIGGPVYRYGTDGVVTDNYVIDDGQGGTGGGPVPSGSYRYFRFAPTALRDATVADSVQLSEFAVLNGATRLTGMSITALNGNSPVGEEPAKAGDNDTATKWLSFNKTTSVLVYDFTTPVAATGYRWATANDSPERDPASWAVYGSVDGTTWTTLDTRTGYAGTTARSTVLPDFGFGGTGGSVPGGTQTLGVGGIARPAPASNVELNTANRGDMNITVSGTPSQPRIYDGGGFTCGRVTIPADWIVVQNYNIRPNSQYGVYITGSNVIVQNCDIKNVKVSGDGDLNAITMLEGSHNKILYNTAVDYVSGDPGSSHTDFIQTWVSSSHPTACSNIQIIGNKVSGPDNPSRDNSIASIHQCIMVEGAGHGGNSGGSGNPSNWYVADNEFHASWNQDVKLDGAANFIFTRNRFTGSSDKAFSFDSQSGSVAYSDNTIGGGYGSVGITLTGGAGPATSPYS